MRTGRSSTARILHDQGVQNLALFYPKRQERARLEIEKAMKTSVSKVPAKSGRSLDLGRAVHSVAAPFLSQNQKLTKCGRAWSKQAVHGFCTLLAPAAIPIHNPT